MVMGTVSGGSWVGYFFLLTLAHSVWLTGWAYFSWQQVTGRWIAGLDVPTVDN